jgi:hypothetical protein
VRYREKEPGRGTETEGHLAAWQAPHKKYLKKKLEKKTFRLNKINKKTSWRLHQLELLSGCLKALSGEELSREERL